ncbi:hypothetical protein NXW89_00040 [Bacteroides thetaiotaomicron]|nr:hypothetical protein [Bacteroides thetaiotaomicron]
MNDKYKPEEIVDLKAQARFLLETYFIGFFFVIWAETSSSENGFLTTMTLMMMSFTP